MAVKNTFGEDPISAGFRFGCEYPTKRCQFLLTEGLNPLGLFRSGPQRSENLLQVSPLCRQLLQRKRSDATTVVAIQRTFQEVLGDGDVTIESAGIGSDNDLSAFASGVKVQNHRLDLTGSEAVAAGEVIVQVDACATSRPFIDPT